jgi:tetratricopeptide (TPR) repeat protein
MTQNVRLQNLRDFTVQIRNDADQIVGTGIAVSMDGGILTCRHVIETAIRGKSIEGTEVEVYFPQLRGGEEKKRKAIVKKYFSKNDDDVVMVKLKDEVSPLSPEQIAVIGTADFSERNPFQTYGYSPVGDYPASRSDGVIMGNVEPPPDRNLLVDPVQLKSRDIAAGMSGAAILDTNRNLVVGVVAERYYSAGAIQDDISYGIDSKVLTFEPFDFELRGDALTLKPAPEFRMDKDIFKQVQEIANYMLAHHSAAEKYSWNSAPAVLSEWTGREDLLKQITEDWFTQQKHVVGLIGFGGEGKSSLARKWVDDVCKSASTPHDGVFWWGFYENRSVDEFLESALTFLSGGKIDLPSSGLRAQAIGKMLETGCYLFVLDGLEVLQYQEGDEYGMLQNNNLRDLLSYFARPDSKSFCLITSRAPLLDLMDYTTYIHHDIDRLSPSDGRALLKKLGVKGADELLDKVVLDWDGHALTLGLLGSYLVKEKEGDVGYLAIRGVEGIPAPTANEPRYDRVHRVLRRYDEHLTEIEREFLKVFSAFRIPVSQNAVEQVFIKLLKLPAKQSIGEILSRLIEYRILRFNEVSASYTTHPLIRAHYIDTLSSAGVDRVKTVHAFVKKYYIAAVRQQTNYSKIENLAPLLEAIHHACLCDDFDGAIRLLQKVEKGYDSTLMFSLGAYDTYIELARAFFPNGDFSRKSLIDPEYHSTLYGNLGIAFSTQCLLFEAERFHLASLEISRKKNKNLDICKDYQNLAETYLYLGEFKRSEENALQGADYARRARDRDEEWTALAYGSFAAYLLGKVDVAEERFKSALNVLQKSEPDKPYLLDMWGGWQALYLLRMNRLKEARAIVRFNMKECKDFPEVVSQMQSVLGDCYLADHKLDKALESYNKSVQIVRAISSQATLIEALIKRGYFFARHAENCEEAFVDLNEALHYSLPGRCRWYEADIRIGFAWAHLANHQNQKARESAELALQMSIEMDYHWGKVDAEEVLAKIAKRE